MISGNKVILTTYESGNNHFYDSTFNIVPRIPPNSRGLYTVEINEMWFKNGEPTVEKGDYVEFVFHYTDSTTGDMKKDVYRCTMKTEIYTYNDYAVELVVNMLKAIDYTSKNDTIFEYSNPTAYTDYVTNCNIKYYNYKNETRDISGYSIGMRWYIELTTKSPSDKTLTNVTMRFSNNYCYLFNDMVEEKHGDKDGSKYTFNFVNPRYSGAYIYLVDTSPLQSEMTTLNANNQAYNITCLSYNSATHHGMVIQGSSSMRTKTKDLSNLRIRLFNDQFDLVKIKEPLYIQLTVTNDED